MSGVLGLKHGFTEDILLFYVKTYPAVLRLIRS
jgi:hypothetical protein